MKTGFKVPRGSSPVPFLAVTLASFLACLPLLGQGQVATNKTLVTPPKSAAAALAGKRAAAPDYTQDVRSDGEAVTVLLNGWPIADMQGGQQAGLINYAVVDGLNQLAVTIAPPPGGKAGSADVATVLIQNGAKNVLSVRWQARAAPPPPLPLHQAATFQSGTHFGPRAWQTAAPITLDEATKAAIRAQIHRFHDLLATKDLNGVVQLFAGRDREDALSHGESPAQHTAAARKDYQQLLADPHWRMAPVRDDRLQFHLLAGKRVVLADYGKDTQVLTTLPTPNGDVTAFELYLSQVNGQWVIVH